MKAPVKALPRRRGVRRPIRSDVRLAGAWSIGQAMGLDILKNARMNTCCQDLHAVG